jgi:ABC-type transport system substrate-binding protein
MRPFASACLALASVAAAGAALGAARPQYGGTLRVEMDAIVRGIDPAASIADGAAAVARGRLSSLVFEPLTAIDAAGLQPWLAARWEQDGRGGRWRFHLRNAVTLHDGTALEAWQVAASLRAVEPAWKVAAENDTITIDPDVPIADLPWTLADDRHAIVVRGAGASLVGSGPFKLDRVDGTRVSLRAHDAYWRARAFVDAVQVETGRAFDAQLGDLEGGRADLVGVRAVDARRAARRGVRVESSNPLELVALVFESHRAAEATLAWRRTIAATINRDAICAVVLQGQAAPARTVLPEWLSGYAPIAAPSPAPVMTRSAVAALAPELREIALRIEPGDGVMQAIAERVAVDAREAGFTVTVQTPAGLAPRPDARLVRVPLAAVAPNRAFAQAASRLTMRGWPPIAAPDGTGLDATYRAERALVDGLVVVPIVHLRELTALGERVGFSARPIVNPLGGWNLADAWVRARP